MLVLKMRELEQHVIDLRKWGLGLLTVTNTRNDSNGPRLGYEAHKDIPVHRRETFDAIEREKGAKE